MRRLPWWSIDWGDHSGRLAVGISGHQPITPVSSHNLPVRWSGALLVLVACAGSPEPNSSDWVEVAAMDVARSEMPAVVMNGQIYVVGGLVNGFFGASTTDSVEVYDPGGDTWRPAPPLPEPRHHLMAAAVDGRMVVVGGYAAGGFTPTDTVWSLDPATAVWSELPDLPQPAGAGAAVTIDGDLYVVGGTPDGANLWRLRSGVWEALAPMPTSREHLAAVAVDGRLWVLGGRWSTGMLGLVEAYDPNTDTWAPVEAMAFSRSGFGATVMGDDLLVAGGEVFSPTAVLDSVERFEVGVWEPWSPLPVPLHGVALATVDGSVYVLSGSRVAGGIDNTGQVYRLDLSR